MASKVNLDSSIIEPLETLGVPAWVIAVLNAPTGTFVNLAGEIIAGGETYAPGSKITGAYLKSAVTATDSNTYIFAPFSGSNALSATIWGETSQQVTYSFYLVDVNYKVLLILGENLSVPDTLTTTTLPDLRTLSTSPRFSRSFSTYIKAIDFYAALALLVNMAVAATTLVRGALFADTLSGDTAVTTNSARITKVLSADYGNSFATAISSIGATKTLLIVKADVTVSAAHIFPATLILQQQNGAVITRSSGSLTFLGKGIDDPLSTEPFFSGFTAGNLLWTGTTYPTEVSSAIMTDASLNAKMRVLTAAFVNRSTTFIQQPAPTTDSVTMNDGHSIFRMPGLYFNTIATRGTTNLPPYTIGSNSSFISADGAISYDSSSATPGNTYMVYTAIHAVNARIERNHFAGGGGSHDGAVSTALIQNGDNCHIHKNYFNGAQAYQAGIVNAGTGNAMPRNCSITENLHKGYMSQLLFITAGYGCALKDNVVDLRNATGTTYFAPIDIEPNVAADRIEDLMVSGNRVDVRGVNQYCTGMILQATSTPTLKNVTCRDNDIIGLDISTSGDFGRLQVGIEAYGIENLKMSGNTIQGAYDTAIRATLWRYGFIAKNKIIQCGNGIVVKAAASGDIFHNIIAKTAAGFSQNSTITESEQEYTVTSAASIITSTIASDAGTRFYNFFTGLDVTLNALTYFITAVITNAPFQTLTTLAPVGTLTVKSVASATDVNIGTDFITSTAHGFNNNARVRYTAGSAVIGGLTTDLTYFIANKTADTFQVSLTSGGAAINLTATGTGTQIFTPVMITKFSSNTYKDNKATDGITLEPTGTSVVYSRYDDSFAAKANLASPAFTGTIGRATETALTPGATPALNAALSDRFTLVPNSASAITSSGGVAGQRITVEITTSGAVSYSISFGVGFEKSQGILATGAITAKVFMIYFEHNGTGFVEISRTPAM